MVRGGATGHNEPMGTLQKIGRSLALFIIGAVMVICGIYFAWTATVVVFILTGQLREGPMFHEMETPPLGEALLGLAFSGAVVWGCVAMRRRILRHAAGPDAVV